MEEYDWQSRFSQAIPRLGRTATNRAGIGRVCAILPGGECAADDLRAVFRADAEGRGGRGRIFQRGNEHADGRAPGAQRASAALRGQILAGGERTAESRV